jgi:sulfur-carrier protein
MEVRIRVPTQLRDLTGGHHLVAVHVDVEGAATVADVLDALGAVHPALERRIRDERNDIRPHVNVFVGADNIRDLGGVATAVDARQEVSIIPAVSGG